MKKSASVYLRFPFNELAFWQGSLHRAGTISEEKGSRDRPDNPRAKVQKVKDSEPSQSQAGDLAAAKRPAMRPPSTDAAGGGSVSGQKNASGDLTDPVAPLLIVTRLCSPSLPHPAKNFAA